MTTNTEELIELFEQYASDMEFMVYIIEDLKDAEYGDDREETYFSIVEMHDEMVDVMHELEEEILKLVDDDNLKERIGQYINDTEYLIHLTEDLKDAEYGDDSQEIYDELSNQHDELINNMFDLQKEILRLLE